MAEVLSQSQIDELLNSMKGGGDPTPEEKPDEKAEDYKKYDFSSPKKFTKDKLKLLKGIYDNYARMISLRLNGVLRVMCEIEVDSVEEQRYFEFNNMLSDTDVMMTLDITVPGEKKECPMMFHISPKIAVNMMDRMLGGSGDDMDIDLGYEYTEIEIALYEKLMKYILDVTENAWSNYTDFTMGEQKIEENPPLFQEISLDEPVIIILLSAKINEVTGLITICIPGTLLSDIFKKTDKRKVSSEDDDSATANRNKIMTSINKSTMEVKAVLGGASLNIQDIYSLKAGDVIDLNKSKDAEVTVFVEKQPWFEGKLGVFNKNSAVQINKRIEREEDEENKDE